MTQRDYEYFKVKITELDETNQSFRLLDKTGNSWVIRWDADPDSRFDKDQLAREAQIFGTLVNAVLLSHIKT